MGRRAQGQLTLSEAERQELLALTTRRKTAQALALRAHIVLSCAQGLQNKAVAQRHRVTQQTVGRWRSRYIEQRLDGLLDAPRSGSPRTIDDKSVRNPAAQEVRVIHVPSGEVVFRTTASAEAARRGAASIPPRLDED